MPRTHRRKTTSVGLGRLVRSASKEYNNHVHGQTEVLQPILDRDGAKARELAEAHVREFEDDIRKMF
ncbi:hypothetical protein [Mycobacterium sp. URHB0021]